jgi:hypothetical protein
MLLDFVVIQTNGLGNRQLNAYKTSGFELLLFIAKRLIHRLDSVGLPANFLFSIGFLKDSEST